MPAVIVDSEKKNTLPTVKVSAIRKSLAMLRGLVATPDHQLLAAEMQHQIRVSHAARVVAGARRRGRFTAQPAHQESE